jgi:DNA-binding NarL/FixJ family response regulator
VSDLRILVVDDHRVFAGALATVIDAQPDITVVGTSDSVAAAERDTSVLDPDVVVLDVDLGGEDGIELARRLRERDPLLRVVILTGHQRVPVASAAIRAGASAFLAKDASVEELTAAIRGAARGESWIPPHLLTGVLQDLQSPEAGRSPEAELLAKLTDRETDVLECMVEGMDRAATARRLFMSVNTVRTHTRKILAKLEVHSSLEAVAVALRGKVNGGFTK